MRMCAARERDERVVREHRRRSEAKTIAHAPHDGARLHVERGERAVAAGDVEEATRAFHAQRAAASPRVTPSKLSARQIDRDEMALAFGDDEKARQARNVHDRAGRWRRETRRDARPHRNLAVAEVVQTNLAVRKNASDAARRDDARGACRRRPPHHFAGRSIETEHFGGGADNQAIAAEERAAQVDARHERSPGLRVTKPRVRQGSRLRSSAWRDARERAIGLGREIHAGVVATHFT